MFKAKNISYLCLAATLVLIPAYAFAQGKGDGKDRAHNKTYQSEDKFDVQFDQGTRTIISDFLKLAFPELRDATPVVPANRHCPPGLAKKNAACLPPGIAKKYTIGQALPPGLGHPLPHDLKNRLGNPPHGYNYVQVGKDILLIAEATKMVVDAVVLARAVGN